MFFSPLLRSLVFVVLDLNNLDVFYRGSMLGSGVTVAGK